MIWKYQSLVQLGPQPGHPERRQSQPPTSKGADNGKWRETVSSNSSDDSGSFYRVPLIQVSKQSPRTSGRAKVEDVPIIWSRLSNYVKRSKKPRPVSKLSRPVLRISIPEAYGANRNQWDRQWTGYSPRRSPSSGGVASIVSKRLSKQNTVEFAYSEPCIAPGSKRPRPRKLYLSLDTSSSVACVLCREENPIQRGLCGVCKEGLRASSELPTPTLDTKPCRGSNTLPSARLSSPWQGPEPRSPETVPQSPKIPLSPFFVQQPTPRKPFSWMPKPTMELVYEAGKHEAAFLDQDLYTADWAKYYFDESNFGSTRPNTTTTGEAGRFIHRGLRLDEYEAVFGTPSEDVSKRNWI